jgi:hypothetical protein
MANVVAAKMTALRHGRRALEVDELMYVPTREQVKGPPGPEPQV